MPPLILDRYRPTEHGLSSLVVAVREILAASGSAVGDERVSSSPDARTIRYYQSLGVLDRPARHDGREAVYGYRHLLQAVVTKLLQAQGYSLAQVQRALLGRTTEALEQAVAEALAGAPGTVPPPRFAEAPPPFPEALPAPEAPPPAAHAAPQPAAHAAPQPAAPCALLTHEVAPGVLVTLDPRIVSDPASLFARITHALTIPTGGSR
ncbi:MAG: MerR family transcriptional regulator [Pseudomonadota bacterium]|nr:MerR family transcriptional regulator [Pseudomonadota bacterium]